MNAAIAEIADAATADAVLKRTSATLTSAVAALSGATTALHDAIIAIRPTGILTVAEMAEAVDRDRNFIDSVWSSFGDVVKGKQTRPASATRVGDEPSDVEREAAIKTLHAADATRKRAVATVNVTRADRNRAVAVVYGAAIKGFGPSAIATAAGIDRNHVLRLARKAGLAPAWRPAGTARNQHTAAK